MEYGRVGSCEQGLDGILLVHDVVLFQLDVGIGIPLQKFPLNFIHVFHQRVGGLEVDNQFAVRQ